MAIHYVRVVGRDGQIIAGVSHGPGTAASVRVGVVWDLWAPGTSALECWECEMLAGSAYTRWLREATTAEWTAALQDLQDAHRGALLEARETVAVYVGPTVTRGGGTMASPALVPLAPVAYLRSRARARWAAMKAALANISATLAPPVDHVKGHTLGA